MWMPFAALILATPVFWLVGTRLRMLWDRWLIGLLVAMPLSWAWLGLWASALVEPAFNQHAPAWAGWPVGGSVVLFLALSVVFIAWMHHARWFAVCWFVLNLCCCLFTAFVAGMAVSGDWI